MSKRPSFRSPRIRDGFTLVELIVVLVILAILAALLIPALSGYIDKSRERAIIAATRQCVTAGQTLMSENYALHGGRLPAYAEILQLSENAGQVVSYGGEASVLEHLCYTENDLYCIYCRQGGCDECGFKSKYTVQTDPALFVFREFVINAASLTADDGSGPLITDWLGPANTPGRIDSNDPNYNDKFAEYLAQQHNGYTPPGGSFSIIKKDNGNNYFIYYTSENINKYKTGAQVAVTVYDSQTKSYTTDFTIIVELANTSGNKYKALEKISEP